MRLEHQSRRNTGSFIHDRTCRWLATASVEIIFNLNFFCALNAQIIVFELTVTVSSAYGSCHSADSRRQFAMYSSLL